jgi:hypothetical protein
MPKNSHPVEGPDGFVHQCRLPLSSAILDMVAGLIRGHVKKIPSGMAGRVEGQKPLTDLSGAVGADAQLGA